MARKFRSFNHTPNTSPLVDSKYHCWFHRSIVRGSITAPAFFFFFCLWTHLLVKIFYASIKKKRNQEAISAQKRIMHNKQPPCVHCNLLWHWFKTLQSACEAKTSLNSFLNILCIDEIQFFLQSTLSAIFLKYFPCIYYSATRSYFSSLFLFRTQLSPRLS